MRGGEGREEFDWKEEEQGIRKMEQFRFEMFNAGNVVLVISSLREPLEEKG